MYITSKWLVQGLPGPRNTLFGPSDIHLDWSKSSGPSRFGPRNTPTPVWRQLLYSENKGADQLRRYCDADLRLCFRIIIQNVGVFTTVLI